MRTRGYAAVLVKVAQNEMRRRLRRPIIPYKLEFFTTFSCQSRCRTCNIWSRYIEDPAPQRTELSPDDIARTAYLARSHVRWISLTGGEVTDRPDFVDIVRGIMDTVGDRLGLLNIITNGLVPERTAAVFAEVARLTRRIPLFVTISLEPTDALYSAVRGIKGGYQLAMESLAELARLEQREPHLQSGYLITLSDLNARVANAMQYTGTEGLNRLTVGVSTDAYLLTRHMKNVNVGRSSPDLAATLDRIWDEYPLQSPLDIPPKIFLGLLRRFLETNRSPLPCSAGQDVLSIDPYGNVLQCFHIGRPLVRLQDWDFDVPRICRSNEFQEALAPTKGCRDCWQACQAYPSMFHHPVAAIGEYLRVVRSRRARRRKALLPVGAPEGEQTRHLSH